MRDGDQLDKFSGLLKTDPRGRAHNHFERLHATQPYTSGSNIERVDHISLRPHIHKGVERREERTLGPSETNGPIMDRVVLCHTTSEVNKAGCF